MDLTEAVDIKKRWQEYTEEVYKKIFCTTKETINKVKRQHSEWEKIIVNEATDKQLISKICTRHLSNLLLWWYLKANHNGLRISPF